jgi:hypothetical protein
VVQQTCLYFTTTFSEQPALFHPPVKAGSGDGLMDLQTLLFGHRHP